VEIIIIIAAMQIKTGINQMEKIINKTMADAYTPFFRVTNASVKRGGRDKKLSTKEKENKKRNNNSKRKKAAPRFNLLVCLLHSLYNKC
jgi:hypothetical protein